MIYFLKQLSKNWIALLGLIPALYDLISAYLPWDFEFPKYIIYSFAVIAFLYASYQVFEEEHQKRKDLEKKLDGPTDYEIIALLTPIDFEREKLLTIIDDIGKEAIEKIKSIHPIKQKNTSKILGRQHDILGSLHMGNGFRYTKTEEQYNKELEYYKNELKKIIVAIDEYKKELDVTLSSWENRYFFIQFLIKNTGITSDSNIHVEITCNNEAIVFEKNNSSDYGLDPYSLIPTLPEEPELPKIVEPFAQLHKVNSYLDPLKLIRNIQHPNEFRKYPTVRDKKCSVTIRDLRVGDQVDLLDKNLIIKKTTDHIEFKASIKSKESTRVLHSSVLIKYQKSKESFFKEST